MSISSLFSFVCFFLSLINLLRDRARIDSSACLRACVCHGTAFPVPEREMLLSAELLCSLTGLILAQGEGLRSGLGAQWRETMA